MVESLPVHEDIKLGRGDFLKYIENYKINIRLLAKHGIKCICYNFMPVFDWTRSSLNHELEDGSNALIYYQSQIKDIDIKNMSLPGWDSSYSKEEIFELIKEYKKIGKDGLWKNLEFFIREIVPVAIECDIKMAIHPDDPPWDIFGLPRIITDEKNIDRFLNIYNDIHHGLTFCSGSLGCTGKNNIPKLIDKYTQMK